MMNFVFATLLVLPIGDGTSPTEPAPTTSARLMGVIDKGWFTRPGVREVVEPQTDQRFLIGTGMATFPAQLPRPTAERIAVARARMDAVCRLVSYQRPMMDGEMVLDLNQRGMMILDQRVHPSDPNSLLITVAVESSALANLVKVRPRSEDAPAPTSQPATVAENNELPLVSQIARAAGTITAALRDGMTTTPEALLQKARAVLEDGDIEQAITLVDRASKIGAGSVALKKLRREIGLRQDLNRSPDSPKAVLALAEWAADHGRLAAVVKPLQESVDAIVRRAGSQAFVDPPIIFYWLGRACEEAHQTAAAVVAYAAAARFGLGENFVEEARQRLGRLQRQPLNEPGGTR